MEREKEPASQESTGYVDKLMAALDHPDPTVRLNAAHILGEKKAVRGVPALIEAYRRNIIDPYILKEIVWALGEIGDPRAFDLLASALRRSFLLVRVEAAKSLGKMGDIRAIPILEEATGDINVSVREEAQKALAKLRPVNRRGDFV